MKPKPTNFHDWAPKHTKTEIWTNYVISPDNIWAKCLRCPSVLSVVGGCTKGLHNHEKTHAPKSIFKQNANVAKAVTDYENNSNSLCASTSFPSASKRQKCITDDFVIDGNTMETMISRMVSKNCLPIEKFITSMDLRSLFLHPGFKLPSSTSTIRQLIFHNAESIKSVMKSEIAEFIKRGKRFSVSLDEWTSLRSKRYMNVNLHSVNDFENLGLIRLFGRIDSDAIVQRLKESLNEFGINIDKHVVALISDGAAVMICAGKKLDVEHQVCLAHDIHLAVVKSLYVNNSNSDNCLPKSVISDIDMDSESSGSEDESKSDIFSINTDSEVDSQAPVILQCDNIQKVLNKVRTISCAFKRSPLLKKHI